MKDDNQWVFFEKGPTQPFEDPSHYTHCRKRDRLNREILVQYLKKLGIHIDDPKFWEAVGNALHLHWDRSVSRQIDTIAQP
jgi:hypothetical protein